MQSKTNPVCLKCGNIHNTIRCPAEKKRCYKCTGYGHYGKVCNTKKSTEPQIKSEKRKARDQERLKSFIIRKSLTTELPFVTATATELSAIVRDFYSHNYNEINALRQTVSDLHTKIQKVEEDKDYLADKLHGTRDENFDLKCKIEKLNEENIKINKQQIFKDFDIRDLKVEIQNLKDNLQHADQLCVMLKEEVSFKSIKLCELQKELQEKDAHILQLERGHFQNIAHTGGPSYFGQPIPNKQSRGKRERSYSYRGHRRGTNK